MSKPAPKLRPIRLREELWETLPTGSGRSAYVGKSWRLWDDDGRQWMTCYVPGSPDPRAIAWEVRPVRLVEYPADEWVPATWRDAMWRYMKRWPGSAGGLATFARYSDEQMATQLRKMGAELATADDIGAESLGVTIGEFANPPLRLGEF